MRRVTERQGVIRYEKDRADLEREAMAALARRQAEGLPDHRAAEVGALFPQWRPGMEYKAGERISDGAGNLYKVAQGHVSQADWPMEGTPALYTPLGPEAGA